MSERDPSYRSDLDGVRALAVLAVVCFHAMPTWAPGGFAGVDVFFVLSGFLITHSIYQGLRDGRFSFLEFWARRIRRIFPALLTVVLAVWTLGWVYLLPAEFDTLERHIRWGLAFAANLNLLGEAGYFDISAELKPLLHLWSLGIEEQFYLVWPACLWLCHRWRINLFFATLLLAVISFFCRLAIPHTSDQAFYLPWTRFWELQTGALLALWPEAYRSNIQDKIRRFPKLLPVHGARWPLSPSWRSNLASSSGLALILAAMMLFTSWTPWPSAATLLPVLGTALIIAGGNEGACNRLLLSQPPVRFIGLISYPLYLWHWPLLSYLRITRETPSTYELAAAVLLSFALSTLTYYGIESLLRYERSAGARWRAPALAAGSCAIFLLTCARVPAHSARLGLDKINDAIRTGLVDPLDSMQTKKFANGLVYREIRTSVPRYTMFIGDSHVAHYVPRIEKLSAAEPSRTLSSLWVSAADCLMLPDFISHRESGCTQTIPRILEVLRAHERNRITRVVWAAYWKKYLDRDSIRKLGVARTSLDDAEMDQRKRGIRNLMQELKSTGVDLTILLDYPDGRDLNPRSMFTRSYLGWFSLGPASLARTEAVQRQGEAGRWLAQTARELGVEALDPIEFLCSAQSCPIRDRAGRPLYPDDNHFIRYAAEDFLGYVDRTVVVRDADMARGTGGNAEAVGQAQPE